MDSFNASMYRDTLEKIARLDREARAEEAQKQRDWQQEENRKDRRDYKQPGR